MFKLFLIVSTGSFFGGGLRYLAQQFISQKFISSFPYGTFVVNIVGCFVIGLIFSAAEKGIIASNEIKLLFATGFCGGFTTFSSFSLENITLIRDGQYLYVVTYTCLSILLGFLATILGIKFIRIF